MKINTGRLKKICAAQGISLTELLARAGVSRTAYYSLARKNSLLPGSLQAMALALDVAPSAFLEELSPVSRRAQQLIREAHEIRVQHEGASFENIWHALVLLDEPPVDRLRRSLLRGQAGNIH